MRFGLFVKKYISSISMLLIIILFIFLPRIIIGSFLRCPFAASCRRKFEEIISKVKSTIEESNASLDDSDLHSLARAIIKFGDEMQSGCGYPQADIPQYLSTLDKLEVPSHMVQTQALVSNLRNEVEGKRMKPADYEGLLDERSLKTWEATSDYCSNCRLGFD